MSNILSIQKFREIKPGVSMNNDSMLTNLISEVEYYKLQKLLGTDIYNQLVEDVLQNSIDPEVKEILDGGLYRCITYFTYARYIQESMLADTFTGMVVKVRTDAQTAPTGAIKNVANEYNDMALMSYNLVRDKIMNHYSSTPEETVVPEFSEIYSIRRHKI